MEEIWKVIPLNTDYEVSNLGNVKSNKKKHKGRLLKPSISKRVGRGYYQVMLSNQGKQKTYKVHILVANAFLGYVPNGSNKDYVVDHIDNNPLNNRLDNLQITTPRINASKDRDSRSKFVGVSWDYVRERWSARIKHNGKYLFLGRFDCELAAAKAYQDKLKQINK